MRKRPLYEIIYTDLLDRIKEGELRPGDKLPCEYELMAKYNVSRTTIRHTMKKLEECNLIYRIKRTGTYLNGKLQPASGTKIIPVVLPGNEMEYASAMQVIGLLHNCFIPVYSTQNQPVIERKHLENLLNTNIDALIFYPCSGQKNMDLISRFICKKVPIVFLDRGYLGFSCPLVTADNRYGMADLVHLLFEYGHRKIAFFAIDEFMYSSENDRFTGYCQALINHGIPVNNDYVFWTTSLHRKSLQDEQADAVAKACQQAVKVFTENPEPPTAVCCCNDNYARALIDAFGEAGFSCPNDISVAGFDDNDAALIDKPFLTTVKQSFRTIGERAITVAMDMCAGKTVRPINYVSTKIIIRESVRVIADKQ